MKNAKEFYDKRMKQDSTIGSVQLMQEYAKEAINELIKEYHKQTYNTITKGGKSKSLGDIAIEFIEKKIVT